MPLNRHYLVQHDLPTHVDYPESTSATSSTSSPRSTADDSLTQSTVLEFFDQQLSPPLAAARNSLDDNDSSCFNSSNSDSYDSAGEGSTSARGDAGRGHHHDDSLISAAGVRGGSNSHSNSIGADLHLAGSSGRITPGGTLHFSRYSGDDGVYGSGMSSRAGSPAPHSADAWDGFRQDNVMSYRSVSRNRSRHPSGTTTPTSGFDKEAGYGIDDYHSHHYQTSALLRKLGGTLAPDTSPILSHKKRRPGWWSKRAETRRKDLHSSTSSTSSSLLGSPSLGAASKTNRNRSCLHTFGAALLRQPWVPTQPLTILFSFLLLACFAATLTTFLVHVLSNDKQPLPWRTHCQEQRPFPHELADSLAPVNVFVGVFSVAAAYERRHLIRSTYMRHSKEIDPATGRPAENVQVKFILGRPKQRHAKRVALEMEMYNDVVVLDMEENMNRGKTHAYFKWASTNATVPVYYSSQQDGQGVNQVGVGFKKADYVVKADDDSFLILGELERHLRITPREKTYWGYLIRNLFMAGEVYALSADLVDYVATYQPLLSWTSGPEDKRVAKWMRMHPQRAEVNWIPERCWIYDHPKAGTTYAHGYLFPDEVERIQSEGRRGITEEERLRRGGDLAQAFSTVSKWKMPYQVPAEALSVEEQVEALVEGGGRWTDQKWRSDNGRGVDAVRFDSVVFARGDLRLRDPRIEEADLALSPDGDATGVTPGVPDRSVNIPSARTTKFGKDLFRDPTDVDAVKLVKRGVVGEVAEDGSLIVEVYNSVAPPAADAKDINVEKSSMWDVPLASDSSVPESTPSSSSTSSTSSTSSDSTSLASNEETSPSATDSTPTPSSDEAAPENTPTGQLRLGAHNYIMPPSSADQFLPPPTLRYDPSNLSVRQQRMRNLPHGGTIAVHYLKYNEWFYETALAFLGREKMWDGGLDAPAFSAPVAGVRTFESRTANVEVSNVPVWEGMGRVEAVDSLWGGARMYGSPIVRENGYVSEGRVVDEVREINTGTPNTMTGRFGRLRGTPKLGMALEEGQEAVIGGEVDESSSTSNEVPAVPREAPVLLQQPAVVVG